MDLTWGGGPPGKQSSGTFLSSNDLVSHQTHKNAIANDTQELLKSFKFLKIFTGACQVGLKDC